MLNLEDIKRIQHAFLDFQQYASRRIIKLGNPVFEDNWTKNPKDKLQGKGCSMVFENGETIEKGGINFSNVKGKHLPKSASSAHSNLSNQAFNALGVSIVFHPKNPFIPTSHANIRFFSTTNKQGKNTWWFGGGYDLTPYYIDENDAVYWHQEAAKVCEPFGKNVYPEFKKNCDDYFWLKHRNETRGIGGLFFDNLNMEQGWTFEKAFEFVQTIGKTYIESYYALIQKHKHRSFEKCHRDFQLYRRGRYVEFNLIYDRGTIFGLQSGGRAESILMSLPNKVHWKYNYFPQADSEEARLYDYLKPIDWLAKS